MKIQENYQKGNILKVIKLIFTLIRTIMLRCPCEYCSITSRTSYGFLACVNLRLATKYLIFLMARIALRCASVNLLYV